jgi:hypothetical protein
LAAALVWRPAVKIDLLLAASAIALVSFSSSAVAEQMNMPGMTMPKTSKKTPPKKTTAKAKTKNWAAKKPVDRKAATKAAPTHAAQAAKSGTMPMPAQPQRQSGSAMPIPMDQSQMKHGTMEMPSNGHTGGATSMPMSRAPTGQLAMGQMSMGHADQGMNRTGALGPYADQRESSGTAWQPDASKAMSGAMLMSGDWMAMAHGTLNLVYDHQSGPRGGDKAFASGMLMGMARHPLGNGTVQFRAMLSPDPLMGPAGYPLLLATGETANGTTPLVDRQHPHDLFMELSASVSQNIGSKSSVFVYGGLPGEPAFGPPPFMHRESILDSPEAPITHHWLDSTHVTFGVVTAGIVLDRFKLEASRFNGREPDQHRWNIETGPLDSTSVRLSWNPTRTLALQGSWGYFRDPEQLDPGVNQIRWSASALWADDVAPGWHTAATLAWGRKSSQGHNDDGVTAEASINHADWTVFGRAERIENRELLGLVDSPAYKVGKVSVGALRDFPIANHFSLGAGGLFSVNFVPNAIAPLYGGHNPTGVMGFLRLKLN